MIRVSIPPGSLADPREWRRKFLERRYRDVYLAELHDPFEVDGIPLSPGEALEKCRPEEYRTALTEYARRGGEAALENACDTFPARIAIPLYRALNSADNERERLLHFRDAAEALVVVLLAFIVGQCRAKGIKLAGIQFPSPAGTRENFTARKLLSDSVAHRLAMLEGLVAALASHPDVVAIEREQVDAVQRLGELNGIRNDFSHYEAMTELEATKVCQDVREQVADAVLAFDCLGEVELVTFVCAVTGKPGMARFELLAGSTQNKNLKERTVAPSALVKCLGIAADHLPRPLFCYHGEIMDATPYLHTELSVKGNRRQIWVLKRRFAQSSSLEFQIVGERELKKVAESAETIEVAVLDELFV